MTPIKKLAIVAAVQLVVLFGIVGFKQYTIWTGTTVVLAAEPVVPANLPRGEYIQFLRYEISEIDLTQVAGDDELWDETVYVELQEGADGIWDAVAIHNGHERSFDGTVLLKGTLQYDYYPVTAGVRRVRYNLEELSVSGASGRDIPWDRGVSVEIKVDRFGNATPRHLLAGGEKFDLKRR